VVNWPSSLKVTACQIHFSFFVVRASCVVTSRLTRDTDKPIDRANIVCVWPSSRRARDYRVTTVSVKVPL